MVGINGAGLEKAGELVRSVGVLTAADSGKRVSQQVEIALVAGQVKLASEPREESARLSQTLATDPRQSVKDPSTPRRPPTDS